VRDDPSARTIALHSSLEVAEEYNRPGRISDTVLLKRKEKETCLVLRSLQQVSSDAISPQPERFGVNVYAPTLQKPFRYVAAILMFVAPTSKLRRTLIVRFRQT